MECLKIEWQLVRKDFPMKDELEWMSIRVKAMMTARQALFLYTKKKKKNLSKLGGNV